MTEPPRLPRRLLLGGAVGLAPCLLRGRSAAAQVIQTDMAGLNAGELSIPGGKAPIPGYFARPQTEGPFATVLVIEEIQGVTPWLRDVCRRLAKRGYLVLAPDLYARIGDPSQLTDEKQIMREVVDRAPDAAMLADLDAAASWAAANGGDPKRLAVMGFGWGGRDAWLYAAHNKALRAAVAWYGPVATPITPVHPTRPMDVADRLNCPLLGLYGGKDESVVPADVQDAAERARRAGKRVEIVYYPEAPQTFAGDDRPTYRAQDATSAWHRAHAWLKHYLA